MLPYASIMLNAIMSWHNSDINILLCSYISYITVMQVPQLVPALIVASYIISLEYFNVASRGQPIMPAYF